MKMWLDDERPAPEGWIHAKTVEEAIRLLGTGSVVEASLDHDLGMCGECIGGFDGKALQCKHRGTGYELVLWMAENEVWPQSVRVHSMNPVGRSNMLQIIGRYKV